VQLNGKVALITGGGTGLGKEIALGLAREGMRLAISYSRSKSDAEETAREARALGIEAKTFQTDLAGTSESKGLVDEVHAVFGQLDLLIHNAGTTEFIPFPDLDAVTEEIWDRLFAVNTRSAFFLAQAAAPMLKQSRGQIITTTSVAGIKAGGSSLPYSVTKAALIHLTKGLAIALAPEVRVNSVAPGLLLTRWAAGFSKEQLQTTSDAALLKQPTDIQDTASAFVMLAKNGSMTGQVIVVDSGLLGK